MPGERADGVPTATERAQTESIFRDVNERVKELGARGAPFALFQDAVCECSRTDCSESIPVTAEEYERIRTHSTWFAIAPSEAHFFGEIERIVEKNGRFWVVEKLDRSAQVAEQLDPRGRDD